MADPQIEEFVIRAFLAANRRERALKLLASPSGRRKLVARLDHFRDFDPKRIAQIPAGEQSVDAIERLLRSRGAGSDCYVISGLEAVDGRLLPLREALNIVVGSNVGSIVSCDHGRLAYYEGEDLRERYLLSRPDRHPPAG